MNKKSIKKSLAPYAFLLIFIIGCLIIFKMFNVKVNELSYDEFMKDLNGGKVTELMFEIRLTRIYKYIIIYLMFKKIYMWRFRYE